MKIENDSRADSSATIRKIQEYQELQQQQLRSQEQQQLRQQQEQLQTQDADPTKDSTQLESDPQQQQALEELQREQAAVDIQAQIQNYQVAEVNESREISGIERSDEAVDVSSLQQDRGEAWQDFSSDDSVNEIPPSVEANATDSQAEAQREEQQKINVQDVLNQMAIQSGKINA